jgi:hypothetical protein
MWAACRDRQIPHEPSSVSRYVRVTGMARGLLDHGEHHVSHVALDEVGARTRTVEIHRSHDGARPLDLLSVSAAQSFTLSCSSTMKVDSC